MSDTQHETLSALVDGELPVEEARFLLRRMDHDVELCAAWGRYHLIRDGLRRQVSPLAGSTFADGVFEAIGHSAQVSSGRRWLKWSGGGVIAAGVAAMALMAVQPGGTVNPVREQATNQVASTGKPAEMPRTAPSVPRWLSVTPSAAQMAEPAAATFYSPGPDVGILGTGTLAPYTDIPGYRASMRHASAANGQHYPMLAVPQSSAGAVRMGNRR